MTRGERVTARLWIWSVPLWRLIRRYALWRARRLNDRATALRKHSMEAGSMADLALKQIEDIELLRSVADRG